MHDPLPSASEKLISPSWLQNPAHHPFLLFEVGNAARDAYLAGHIPRAVYFDTNRIERPSDWNRIPDDELERVLISHGITHEQPVVLYARGSTAAARVGVILLYAGVREVRLLDGGLQAWNAAGFPVEGGENRPVSAEAFGVRVPARPGIFTDTKGVRKMLSDGQSVVVSIRSWEEYIGETSGYDFIQPKGRIAGAVWGRAGVGKDVRSLPHFLR